MKIRAMTKKSLPAASMKSTMGYRCITFCPFHLRLECPNCTMPRKITGYLLSFFLFCCSCRATKDLYCPPKPAMLEFQSWDDFHRFLHSPCFMKAPYHFDSIRVNGKVQMVVIVGWAGTSSSEPISIFPSYSL